MSRWLRSWGPYLLLGVLIVVLYVRTMFFGAPDHAVVGPPPMEMGDGQVRWPEPPDPQVLKEAALRRPLVAVMFGLLSFVLVSIAGSGIVLAGWAVWSREFRTVWKFAAPPLPRWSWGDLGRILFLTLALILLFPFAQLAFVFFRPELKVDAHAWVTVSMLLLDAFVVLVVLTFAADKGRSALTVFGLSGRSRWGAVKTGLVGYMAAFPWLFLLLFLTVEISNRIGFQPPIEPIHRLVFLEQRPWVLMLTGLLACVAGPIAEEFLFRGVLYSTIRRQVAAPLAMLITGAVFALVHTNIIGFLPITLLGGLLAYVYERTGSLLAPMTVHIVHNTLLMSMAMIYRQLGLHG